MGLVPRLLNRVYASMTTELKTKPGIVQSLFQCCFDRVRATYERSGSVQHGCLENLIFGKLKAALGGNVKFIVTGSAPIKCEVLDWLKIVLGVNICEGYGLTENAAGTSLTRPDITCSGNVGWLQDACVLRLKD